MVDEKSGIGTPGNVITIVVFVAVITIGLWGAINAVHLAPRIFSSIRNSFAGEPPLALSAPQQLVSGRPFTLSWKDASRTKGLYTITYECVPDFEVGIRSSTTTQALPCNTPFAVPATQTSIELVPNVQSGTSVTVPLHISYIADSGTQTTAGKTTVVVTRPQQVVHIMPTPTHATTSTSKPSGTPDFVIIPIAIGVVDPYTGQFIAKNAFGSYETVTYKFDVANRGAGPSGRWSFSANLPTQTPTPYQSPIQKSLGVGDHTQFTLNFSAPVSGVITINVDPMNAIAETDEGNNSLSQYISVVY